MASPTVNRDVATAPPPLRVIAQGQGWRVSDVVCRLGPHDPSFEERHEHVAIAAVLAGTFQYRSEAGRALLYPGAFMLGNAGKCYECGHEHGAGDRCLALHYAPEYFEEIAAGAAGSSRFRFRTGMLPALRPLALPSARLHAAVRGRDPLALEEAVVGIAERVVATLAHSRAFPRSPPARDQRRISGVLRNMEARSGERLELAGLAARACMSKYHFLRTFRCTVGLTPYQFLLGLRLRRAAQALSEGAGTVARVALDSGFGDLSGFNAHFRAAFGLTPGAFRRGDRMSANAP